MSASGRDAFRLAFEISPILLTRGIAENIPGGVLPIVALTDASSFATGLLTSGPMIDFDNFFAHWYVLPGGTLQNQSVATYPFANQAVAANAVISGPLGVSMMMVAPARAGNGAIGGVGGALTGAATAALSGANIVAGALGGGVLAAVGGYTEKLAIMTALQKTIAQHNASGGTYSVITPAYIYTDCIMNTPGIRDVSAEGETQQRQVRWQWDFLQPLVLTQAAADGALNSLMQKLQKLLPLSGPSQTLTSAGLGVGSTAILPSAFSPVQGATSAALSLVPQ
jgi:hypothetical protein